MIYAAHCHHCNTRWKVVPPEGTPMDLIAAVKAMENGLCPECGNNGGRAPVVWRWRSDGDIGITKAEVRKRREAAWTG